jgi:striatin 1/3/4
MSMSNASLPVSLPNVPPFDQMAYGTRPRKAVNDVARDFSLMNGTGSNAVPNSASSSLSSQADRSSPNPSVQQPVAQPPQPQNLPLSNQPFPTSQPNGPALASGQDLERDSQPFAEPTTAIFRPDDRGEWRERLRQSHEAEQARLAAEGIGHSSWRARDDDDDDGKEEEVEDDVSSVMVEGDDTKVWKTKRTLRKLVDSPPSVKP